MSQDKNSEPYCLKRSSPTVLQRAALVAAAHRQRYYYKTTVYCIITKRVFILLSSANSCIESRQVANFIRTLLLPSGSL